MLLQLSINATRSSQATWGDTQYAEGLARTIRAEPGCEAALLVRGEAPAAADRRTVVLHIAGPHLEEPVPGLPNLLWMISPPNLAPVPMLGRYQAVLCGSRLMVGRLAERGVAAEFLPQATETGHFHPGRRPPQADDIPLVFVGGHAPRADRRIVLEAVQAGFEPQIWGPGWKGVVPDRLWRGERLGYDALAQVYASARVVLNSHMPVMARAGFMSNRSYDALASGAMVVSDPVAGFAAPGLPELRVAGDSKELARALEEILAAPPLLPSERLALHHRLAARYGFEARAAVILATARRLLAEDQRAPQAYIPGRRPATDAPRLTDPATSAPTIREAMLGAATEILGIARFLEQPGAAVLAKPEPAAEEGVIHPLMADLRDLQRIAFDGTSAAQAGRIDALAAGARRVAEVLQDPARPLRGFPAEQVDGMLAGILHNEPLWAHGPEGFERDLGKVSLALQPRKEPPASPASLGVFLHLHHDDLAPTFAKRLGHIRGPFRLYVSTDSAAKAERIVRHLPAAEIRVLENRGRDIWPKLYGFGDAHSRHEVVLHLHGKKSRHSERLDDWLAHILDCLIGSPGEVNRILSFFTSIPRLGMVAPVTFRGVLGAAHWGANRDIARELAWRMGLQGALPDDNGLRFPVGSMFWARTAAIRPLLDLRLRPDHFPPEAGQVDGTLAHAVERMLGVTCRATGHHILPVAGAGMRVHMRHQKRFGSNGELRAALDGGAFDA